MKKLLIYSAVFSLALTLLSACNFLDRKPIVDVAPDSYFRTDAQLSDYMVNYYNGMFYNSRGQSLYHGANWRSGVTLNDEATDNLVNLTKNKDIFTPDPSYQVSAGQVLPTFAPGIRAMNYFIQHVNHNLENKLIQGNQADINQALGEAYFFRAMLYYRALAVFGDYPIVKETLPLNVNELKMASRRMPRNEVAKFILSDLDKAFELVHPYGYSQNVRINKSAVELFKSRVALYEGTFEKYHKGSGRVPGDQTWPGAKMDYNKGKTFDIDANVKFFLSQAMDAAKYVADKHSLTTNNHQITPSGFISTGFNPYFDMYSSVDLSSNDEVLLWKQYSTTAGVTHDAAYILTAGSDRVGFTRSMVNSFIMKNGLPIYANGSDYPGDSNPATEANNRDERMQLFVFHPGEVLRNDLADPVVKKANEPIVLDPLLIITNSNESTNPTGYRPRKYSTYSYAQMLTVTNGCYTGCIIFRAAEAYLNYIEASYELNGSIDDNADKYWKAIRTRAGVDPDYNKTIQATNLDKEFAVETINGVQAITGDLAVYSGDQKVSPTLYNIRRERRCELISEGFRWDDLMRWRSFDMIIGGKYTFQPLGINFWASEYQKYGESIIADPSNSKSNVSAKEISTYLLPNCKSKENNKLWNGYSFKKAFYLTPIGVEDILINELKKNDPASSTVYQNIYWPTTAAKALE